MSFTSLTFLFIFIPMIVVWIFLAEVYKKKDYIVFSLLNLIFLATVDIKSLPLILCLIIFNYVTGKEFKVFAERKKIIFSMAVAFNLMVLGIYKYSSQKMPVGLSFFTFTAISYLADKKNDESLRDESFFECFFYMTFFPKFLSGPIVQYRDMEGQIGKVRYSLMNYLNGGYRFIVGLLKKVLIADRLGESFSLLMAEGEKSSLTVILLVVLYGFQIYFDFSGYSDMAIGLASVFGYKFKENFNYPYMAESVSDFWRRWHISLGNWFKNYLYIPLGGNRCSKTKQLRNLFIVWIATGIWHGKTLNFIFWGLYHGIFVSLEKFVIKDRIKNRRLKIAITNFVVFFGWIFFFSTNLETAFNYIKTIFLGGKFGFIDKTFLYYFRNNLFILVVCVLGSAGVIASINKKIMNLKSKVFAFILGTIYFICLVFCLAELIGSTYTSFLYFAF